MKIITKSLGIGIAIGLAVSISVVYILIKDIAMPTSSVYPEDLTKPIPQDYLAFLNPSLCSSKKEIDNASGVFYECILSSSNATAIGNLPSPIFRYVNVASNSPYGAHVEYPLIAPSNLLSPQQVDKVIDVIRNDPQIKSQPFAWKISKFEFYPSKDSWYANVYLVIHGIIHVNELGYCGWTSTITIDLNTLTIVKKENIDVVSYNKC